MSDDRFRRRLWREGGDALERWTNAHLDRQPPEGIVDALAHLSRISQALGQMKDPPEQLRALAAQRHSQFSKLQAKEDFQAKVLGWAELGLEIAGLTKTASSKRGRPRGSAPGLAEADADITRITALWKDTFGISRRAMAHQSPNAVEIATRRHGVDPDQLENFRKNRSKRSKK